jgi:hypothetical protein
VLGSPSRFAKATASGDVGPDPNESMSGFSHSWRRQPRAGGLGLLGHRRALHQDTPETTIVHPVDLQGDQLAVDVPIKAFADADHGVRAVHGVVDWEHGRGAILGDAEMAGMVQFGPDRQEASALWDPQHLRPSFVDPHELFVPKASIIPVGMRIPPTVSDAGTAGLFGQAAPFEQAKDPTYHHTPAAPTRA